jgi:hypothetical protein
MVTYKRKWNIFKQLIQVFFFLALLISCRAPQPIYTHQQPQKVEKLPDQILFLTFKIQEDSASTAIIELLEKNFVSGTLKGTSESSQTENRLIINQIDDIQHVLSEMSIDHPLIKYVEYVNEAREFETKLVRQPSAEFFIRVALQPQTSYLRIDEVRGDRAVRSTQIKIR